MVAEAIFCDLCAFLRLLFPSSFIARAWREICIPPQQVYDFGYA